jgi:hypothetical protein
MRKQQINKQLFVQSLKHLFCYGSRYRGLVKIRKENLDSLIEAGLVERVGSRYNSWIRVLIGRNPIELVKVKPEHYKVVSGGDIGAFLRNYNWKCDEKNVYTCGAVSGKRVMIERVILNFVKYGYFKQADLDKAAHHMWFRFCALACMLKSLDQQVHADGHKEIGYYDRAQVIEIKSITDLQFLVSEIDRVSQILAKKLFSLEF